MELAANETIEVCRLTTLAFTESMEPWNPYITLRCEVAAMSRRAPVWVNYPGAGLSYSSIRRRAEGWADWFSTTEKPWVEMSGQEKSAWARSLVPEESKAGRPASGIREKVGAFAAALETEGKKRLPDDELRERVREEFGQAYGAETIRKYAREYRKSLDKPAVGG